MFLRCAGNLGLFQEGARAWRAAAAGACQAGRSSGRRKSWVPVSFLLRSPLTVRRGCPSLQHAVLCVQCTLLAAPLSKGRRCRRAPSAAEATALHLIQHGFCRLLSRLASRNARRLQAFWCNVAIAEISDSLV